MTKSKVWTIKWAMLPDGAFVAGDTATGRTYYAYPDQCVSLDALYAPNTAAEVMTRQANRLPNRPYYNEQNWVLIAHHGEGARL